MIEITENAAAQILKASADSGSAPVVSVGVVGGGCSGLSYKLDFVEGPKSDKDKLFERDGVKLYVDPKSYLYLKGTTLDFSGGLNGKGFEFRNPNAKRSCGCGASFAV